MLETQTGQRVNDYAGRSSSPDMKRYSYEKVFWKYEEKLDGSWGTAPEQKQFEKDVKDL